MDYLLSIQIFWSLNRGKLDPSVRISIQTNISSEFNTILENKRFWLDLIGDNIWVEYFNKNRDYIKEGWIDFESEIASVIKSLDENMKKSSGRSVTLKGVVNFLSNEFLWSVQKCKPDQKKL